MASKNPHKFTKEMQKKIPIGNCLLDNQIQQKVEHDKKMVQQFKT